MTPRVAVLIPAFNCAAHVQDVVEGVRRHVPDVLVVDDGSSDETGTLARLAGARVVRHPANAGKAEAIRSGLAVLLGEPHAHILMMDADGQHAPEDAPAFLAMAGQVDFILGNRLWNRAAVPAKRYWTNYIGTRALELMSGFPVEDSQCGFRMVSTALLRRMRLVSRRYAVDTEILLRAGSMRASFAHVPVRVIYATEVSRYRPLADTVDIVFSSIRFKTDGGNLHADPGPDEWRRTVPAPEVLAPAGAQPDVGLDR